MDVVSLTDIGKRYDFFSKKSVVSRGNLKGANNSYFWALKGISFSVEAGKIIGIIGSNGAGKTTLLNIIAGVVSPTVGKVSLKGKVAGLFNLGTGFEDELTGRENIFLNAAVLGIPKKEIKENFSEIVHFSGLEQFLDMPLGNYSQGMRLRLGFSVAMQMSFDVFVIDEMLMVGDAVFQSKCFEKLVSFRDAGKAMIVTTQSIDLIERLTDEVVFLDKGRLIKKGLPEEVIKHYRSCLGDEALVVRADSEDREYLYKTKWWEERKDLWGIREGTKDIEIESVSFLSRFKKIKNGIKSGAPLKIKVKYRVKKIVKKPHFGIAFFREDGVYCYGPNTNYSGYDIGVIHKGKGSFTLKIKSLPLMPGNYVITIAIWDEKEVVAYDRFNGFFKLKVKGDNPSNMLIRTNCNCKNIKLASDFKVQNMSSQLLLKAKNMFADFDESSFSEKNDFNVVFYGIDGIKKTKFLTGESVRLVLSEVNICGNIQKRFLWIGLFREDNVFLHALAYGLKKNNRTYTIDYSQLMLLPGKYFLLICFIDNVDDEINVQQCKKVFFNMFFNRSDHGTIYFENEWKFALPR